MARPIAETANAESFEKKSTSEVVYGNMGLVRYVMAFAVMVAHFNEFFGWDLWFPISSSHAVGGFFGLSGFLVYASYQRRPDLKRYISKRAARILPSYIFIVLLCAIALCSLSSLPAHEYFSSSKLYLYLAANLTCLNFLQPTLPGVFDSNVVHAVNGSLWTIKIEWCLYLSVPIVVWIISRFKWRIEWTVIGIYLMSVVYRIIFFRLHESTGSEVYEILGRQFVGQLLYFYWGVLLFFRLEWVMRRKWYISALCFIGMAVTRNSVYLGLVFEPMIVTTLAVIVSAMPSWIRWLNGSNNLSYDMYLYHFPIAQSLWVLLDGRMEVTLIFLIYCVLTVALAAMSWFGIGVRFKRSSSRARFDHIQ